MYRSQIAELQKRCETQSRDLEGSGSFFNAADKSSDSDIIRACQRLNAELQQETTYMADCLVEELGFRNSTTDPTEQQISVLKRASDHIGLRLAQSLSAPHTPDYIPLLLQTASQAYLASALSSAASSWTFSEPRVNEFIYEMYDKLRSVGEELSSCISL